MTRVRFEPSGFTVISAGSGEVLSEVAERGGFSLEMICGGRGKCGRCKVLVKKGAPPASEDERRHLSRAEIEAGYRLACCLEVRDDMVVEIPAESARSEQIILEDSMVSTTLDPFVRRCLITVPEASLERQTGNLERVLEAILGDPDAPCSISVPLLNRIGEMLREGSEMSVTVRDSEIIDVDTNGREMLGAAIDIGTTTVVCYLIDLITGDCLSVKSKMNPQIRHGDDVLSRMSFAMQCKKGIATLQNLIADTVRELIDKCCDEASVDRGRVYEVMIVGNTAMHHMFFGLDTYSLGRSPYVPQVSRPYEVKASSMGLGIAPEGYVVALPNVAGFVGADHIGVLLASRLWESEPPRMVIDIGTNGEISIGSKNGIASTSCAAGPALEGGNIRHGMRGAAGAIDHVSISRSLEVSFTTINGKKPKGVCGSAVVDAIAEMFRCGIIDSRGKIDRELNHPRVRVIEGELQFVLADESESATGGPISILQRDIGEVLSAKAAMYVGATVLMEEMEVDRVESILLAGAFGNYISPRSAMVLGLFPEIPLENVLQIGNAAGSGAKIALLNRRAREDARRVAREVKYVELAARSDFQERFYEALYIPHFDQKKFPEVMASVVG